MSFDGGLPPPVVPVAAQPGAGGRRRGWMLVGALLLLAGLAGGGVLLSLATTAEGRTVRGFARAPIGCTTTLQFDRGGLFTFYVETAGRTEALGGDCSTSGKTFRHQGVAPTVSIELTDASGAPVALSNFQGQRYAAAGFAGRSLAQAAIPAAGTYRVAATADVADIGLAVGGDAVAFRNELVTWGAIALMVGGVVGGALLTFGARRRRLEPREFPAAPPPWAPPSV